MEPGEQEITFEEVDRRYVELKRQQAAGAITAEELDSRLKELMVLDEEGRWWAKSRTTGEWHYHDGANWVQGTPPAGGQAETSEQMTVPPLPSEGGRGDGSRRGGRARKALLWVLAATSVVVVAVVAVVFLGPRIFGGQEQARNANAGSEMASVPEVVGKPRAEAEESLASKGFEVKVNTQESSEADAGKVIKQVPSNGEAQKGSEVAIAVGEGPKAAAGYELIEDADGNLSVEVPSGWQSQIGAESEGAGSNWSDFLGSPISSSITVAESLDAWYGPEPATGAYIVASKGLAQSYTDDELLRSGPFSGFEQNPDCSAGSSEDFDRSPYSGKIETWLCPTRTFYMISAAPEGRECVVLMQIGQPAQGASKAEREAVEHILNTFDADCGSVANAKTKGPNANLAKVG